MKRKFGKLYTIIEGINDKDIDIKEVTKKLKSQFACGGTFREEKIELQGNHKSNIRDALVKLGFAPETVEIQK